MVDGRQGRGEGKEVKDVVVVYISIAERLERAINRLGLFT